MEKRRLQLRVHGGRHSRPQAPQAPQAHKYKDGSNMTQPHYKLPYTQYSFQENLSTNMLEVLENGLVTHEIPMNLIKFFKYGMDDFIKYPQYRHKVKTIYSLSGDHVQVNM